MWKVTYGGVSTDGTTLTYTPANRLVDYTAVLTYTASDGGLTTQRSSLSRSLARTTLAILMKTPP